SEKQDGDVTAEVDALLAACRPTSSSESRNEPLPPRVRFGWDRVHFEGYVKDVGIEYQLFHPDGRPIRATCQVTMQKVAPKPARQNPTSGTPAIHRTIDVVAGDSLPGIAYKEYGDPARWRALAILNAIDDPMRLRPGARLLVPPPREAMEMAAR
ncbi:MAG TPA: peptidase M23, partial [Actinomycetota bacterium]|nr:peptidase M23 [Actinomycetota bacterium]